MYEEASARAKRQSLNMAFRAAIFLHIPAALRVRLGRAGTIGYNYVLRVR